MVLQLVSWWWCCCCLFLCQWMTLRRLKTPVAAAAAAVAAVTVVAAVVAVVAVAALVDNEDGVQWWQWGGVLNGSHSVRRGWRCTTDKQWQGKDGN
jgi:hypothetical protein